MYARYIENRGDEFNSLIQPSKEIPFRLVQLQFSSGEDFRHDLVFQSMDFDAVCKMRNAGLGGRMEERNAHWDEEERQGAGAEGRIACAREGESDIAVGCAGEPFEAVDSVNWTVGACDVGDSGCNGLCLRDVRASRSLLALSGIRI